MDGNGIRKDMDGNEILKEVDGNRISRRWKEEEGKRGDGNADRGKANRSFESAFIQ